jgi:hypothetical protein
VSSFDKAVGDESADGERRRPRNWSDLSRGLPALILYAVAGAAYIAIGVFFEIMLFSWLTSTLFLVFVVWVIPFVVRRLR